MSELLDAVLAGASPETLAATPMPEVTRAVFVRREDQNMSRESRAPTRTRARACTWATFRFLNLLLMRCTWR